MSIPPVQVTGHHELTHTQGPEDIQIGVGVSDARRKRLELFPHCEDGLNLTGILMAQTLHLKVIGKRPWVVVFSQQFQGSSCGLDRRVGFDPTEVVKRLEDQNSCQ